MGQTAHPNPQRKETQLPRKRGDVRINRIDDDQTRRLFNPARKRDPRLVDFRNFMLKPKWFVCPECSSKEFRPIVDSAEDGNACLQLFCAGCTWKGPVVQLGVPQMIDDIAKQLGIWTPDQGGNITPIEID